MRLNNPRAKLQEEQKKNIEWKKFLHFKMPLVEITMKCKERPAKENKPQTASKCTQLPATK